MTTSGDYVTPVFNGSLRFEKPVLTYWLIAASYRIFGISERSARLPSALAALGTVLLTCLLAGRLHNPGLGLTAGVVLACCLQFIALGRWAITDMHLCFFISASLVLFYLGFESPGNKKGRASILLSFVFCGLAVLDKGPVGFALPAAIAGAYLALTVRERRRLGRIPLFPGLAVICAVALPWYVIVTWRSHFEFFRVFILQHNLERFLGEVAPGGQHVAPFYYYLPCLLLGVYPWTFLTLQAILSPLPGLFGQWRTGRVASDRVVFPLVWTVLVLLFFSFSRAKLPTYITPAFPPLAVLIACYLENAFQPSPGESRQFWRLSIPAGLGLVFAACVAGFLTAAKDRFAQFPLENLPFLTAGVFLAGPAAALAVLLMGKPRGAFILQAAGQTLLALLTALLILPLVSRERQEPQITLLREAGQRLGTKGALAAYRYRKTALTFYSRRVIIYLEADDPADKLNSLNRPLAIVTREKYLPELQRKFPGLEVWGRDKGLILLGFDE